MNAKHFWREPKKYEGGNQPLILAMRKYFFSSNIHRNTGCVKRLFFLGQTYGRAFDCANFAS